MGVEVSFTDTVTAKEIEERPSLTEFEVEVLSYIEQLFWTNSAVPSQELVAQGLRVDTTKVENALKNPHLIQTLNVRGVPISRSRSDVLSPTQVVLVNILLNVHDKTSLRQKLQSCNVSIQQYNTWLRDPVFQNYLRIRTEALFEATDLDAYKALSEAVMDGDVQAMKLFFEMRGIYNPRMQIDVSIETVVYKIIEVVAKHVKDKTVLDAIATEMSEISRAS